MGGRASRLFDRVVGRMCVGETGVRESGRVGQQDVGVRSHAASNSTRSVRSRLDRDLDEDEASVLVGLLRDNLLFAHMDSTTLRDVVRSMFARAVRSGVCVVAQGDAHGMMVVVKSGTLDVCVKKGYAQVKLWRLAANDVYGELSMVGGAQQSASIVATSDAELWILERDAYMQCSGGGLLSRHVDDVAVFLSSVPSLRSAGVDDVVALAAQAVKTELMRGQWAVQPGSGCDDALCIVYKGDVTIVSGGDAVAHLFETECYGIMGYMWTGLGIGVRAERDHTIVLRIPASALQCMNLAVAYEPRRSCRYPATRRQCPVEHSGTPCTRKKAAVVIRRKSGDVTCVGHADDVWNLHEGLATLCSQEAPSNSSQPSLTLQEVHNIGKGGFSRVSRVFDVNTGNEYALKQIPKAKVVHCYSQVNSERNISRNVINPFCIRQYATFTDDRNLYMLMDLMDGGDLSDLVKNYRRKVEAVTRPADDDGGCCGCFGPSRAPPAVHTSVCLSEEVCRYYVASIACALHYLHNESVVYRDLKPENVLINAKGFAKLGDFGLAKRLPKGKRTFTLCGTPGYMAPEVVAGHGYSHEVDWWSLGVLMYVWLVGHNPFQPPNSNALFSTRRSLHPNFRVRFPHHVSEDARVLIRGLLRRNAAMRFDFEDLRTSAWFMSFDWDSHEMLASEAPRLSRRQRRGSCRLSLDITDLAKVLMVRSSVDQSIFKDF